MNCINDSTSVGCLPLFASAASYLPKPNDHAYQFVYVDSKGAVGSRSSPFTFGAPKPLEDLVTLEEGGQEDGAGEDMLMVIPRAELLQVSKSALLQGNTVMSFTGAGCCHFLLSAEASFVVRRVRHYFF